METRASSPNSNRKRIYKIALIVDLILCYMTFLTLLSYMCGPERYERSAYPLVQTQDYVSNEGEQGAVGGTLHMRNSNPGVPSIWQAEVTLDGWERIWMTYQIDCPVEFQGGILTTDLFNEEASYDHSEQENTLVLQPAMNKVEFYLYPGEEHPVSAKLRFFTLDAADYQISALAVYGEILLPRVPPGLLWAAVCIFLSIPILILLYIYGRKDHERR